jgi:hypothetical protein
VSDTERKRPAILPAIGKGFCFVVLAFVGLVVLSIILPAGRIEASFEILWHLATGFIRFLQTNLGRISSDAGTWGPGVACFLLAIVVIHWFGATWARRRERVWRISNSLALGTLFPLLFAISFLVPGAILQIGSLKKTNWFQSNRHDRAFKQMHARNIAQAAHVWATTEGGDRFPSSTAVMISPDLLDETTFKPLPVDGSPGEPPLYLGAGLTLKSDPALPLVISGTYSSKDGTYHRTVITIGSEFVEIRDDDLDSWIEEAMSARNVTKP